MNTGYLWRNELNRWQKPRHRPTISLVAPAYFAPQLVNFEIGRTLVNMKVESLAKAAPQGPIFNRKRLSAISTSRRGISTGRCCAYADVKPRGE
jgi:hypothetical protein